MVDLACAFSPDVAAPVQLETVDQRGQLHRSLRQSVADRRRFLDHGGILLRHLIDAVDGGADFLQTNGLFAGSGCDRVDIGVDPADELADLVERASRLADELDRKLSQPTALRRAA